MTSGSTFGGWPPTHSRVRTSEVNSWPSGMPAKRTEMSVPGRVMAKDGLRASSSRRVRLTFSETETISSRSSFSSLDFGPSSREATSSTGSRMFSR